MGWTFTLLPSYGKDNIDKPYIESVSYIIQYWQM